MRHPDERMTVQRLVREGCNDCEISRRTGVPRTTVRDWRRLPAGRSSADVPACDRCLAPEHDFARLPGAAYGYVLGQYLGDGHVVHHRRGSAQLRIFMDLLHLNVAERTRTALLDVLPQAHVAYVCRADARMVMVSCYSRQWPCLLPQHGPGRKHERKIALVPWQQRIVDRHPDQLVRGLLHSDGWRGTNTVSVNGKRYAYPRYNFTQRSDDIRTIFTDALDQLGIRWRRMNAVTISIARKSDVAALDAFVERKS